MGGKQRGQGRRLRVSIAGVILSFAAACAPCNRTTPVVPACLEPAPCVRVQSERLASLSRFISRGDFEGAMQASQRVLSGSPKSPPGDEALLNLGLLCAHYANPKRDYRKALGYFARVEREFPESPLVEEARIWVGVLEAFEKAKQVDLEIEQKKKELGK